MLMLVDVAKILVMMRVTDADGDDNDDSNHNFMMMTSRKGQ